MRLPNGEKAIVDDRKLRDYLLSPSHPHGRHHARLFRALLGIDAENADLLKQALLDAAANAEAVAGKTSDYGRKYEVRFAMQGRTGPYNVLSVWIVPSNENVPYLVTAYVE